ncbi:DUF4232 domain-containing protein [Streptomyces sp. NPDC044780]|uniref:DUF4232 domain-containing protein n=1 Tax=unclassified Streptomyces TaxID=2593676 RepID=UPI0033C65BAA
MHVTAYRRGRTVRTIAASMLAVAALSLTAACGGDGGSDTAGSAGKAETSASAKAASSGGQDAGTERDTDTKDGRSTEQGTDLGASKGTGGAGGEEDTTGVKDAETRDQNPTGGSRTDPIGDCDINKTPLSLQEVKSPVNHLLLKATNGAGAACKLVGYPSLKFGADAQAATPAYEDSKPQSVVVLAPGESAYAGLTTSAADGSGAEGGTADSLDVFIDGNENPTNVELPGGSVFVDSDAQVTYWQADVQDALSW